MLLTVAKSFLVKGTTLFTGFASSFFGLSDSIPKKLAKLNFSDMFVSFRISPRSNKHSIFIGNHYLL
ncbi:hypothetical protein JCM14108_684 [Lentilactobacillus farraginis DSM 18382 = JCM 14108]|uniref:Uncharacterized protein n=1 Tax=Lentilactobacillus farraginis DSM 18382 = JCM 14108 TaxID=1423743 RepID=X0P9K0_9LACO|nr:hypothetical protein JCM14108_684 [Lentilactobacillus farraginis DSM 18382 = JCM 14108]